MPFLNIEVDLSTDVLVKTLVTKFKALALIPKNVSTTCDRPFMTSKNICGNFFKHAWFNCFNESSNSFASFKLRENSFDLAKTYKQIEHDYRQTYNSKILLQLPRDL